MNRDDAGGSLRGLLPAIDAALASGSTRIVLDNTYVSRASRAAVVQAAAARGAAVRCVWLSTSVDDAQVNAARRLVERYGRLPGVDELAALRRRDPAAMPPTTQFRYQRELEPPTVAEGFTRVDVVPFERRADPSRAGRAVIVWCDGILARSRSGHRVPAGADDVVVDPRPCRDTPALRGKGVRLLGLSWQPEIAGGTRTAGDVAGVFARMNELLGGGWTAGCRVRRSPGFRVPRRFGVLRRPPDWVGFCATLHRLREEGI